jgi:protein gp37
MGADSNISWTDHTFNPWWGCVEVSPACDDCYARKWSERCGYDGVQRNDKDGNPKPILPILWGKDHPIREFGEKHWNEPLKWNRDALKDFGRPARVFCGSMCDILEVHPDAERIRPRLKQLVRDTMNLEWLLLTKRGLEIEKHEDLARLPNVRFGVTVETQDYDWRIRFPFVEWLSVEPMLGPLDISRFSFLRWVVAGGESRQRPGREPRETKLEWLLDLGEQCQKKGIAFHVKQTGEVLARKLGLKDKAGKVASEWPAGIQVQQFPSTKVLS